MHVPQSRCWNQRDCGLGSSLLPCGFWGWNFCNQACPQVPLTVELSHYPCFGADMQCSGDDLEFLITPTPSVLELQAWTTTPGFWSVYFVVPKWYLWCLFNCVCSCVDIMYVSTGARGGQKLALALLKLHFQMDLSHQTRGWDQGAEPSFRPLFAYFLFLAFHDRVSHSFGTCPVTHSVDWLHTHKC